MSQNDYKILESVETGFENRLNSIINPSVAIQTALNGGNSYHRFSGLDIDSNTIEMSSYNANIVQTNESRININRSIKLKKHQIIIEHIENLMSFIVFVWCFLSCIFLLVYILFVHDTNWSFCMIFLGAYIIVWILLVQYEMNQKEKDYSKFRTAFLMTLIILIILVEYLSYLFEVGSVYVIKSYLYQ